MDHLNVRFFFWVTCLHCFLWFLLYYLLHLLILLSSSHKFISIQIFYLNTVWIYKFFENHPQIGVFCNVNISNLENVLQRNLTTDRAGKFMTWRRKFWKILCSASTIAAPTCMYVLVYPKKTLDTSLRSVKVILILLLKKLFYQKI